MGFLRILLALAVIATHTTNLPGTRMLPGWMAVQTFYIISGFYMALVLNEKYTGAGSYPLFIGNRFLRIFPTYWAVLGLSLLIGAAGLALGKGGASLTMWQKSLPHMSGGSIAFLALSNVIIFGQDAAMFLQLGAGGGLVFAPHLSHATVPIWPLLIVSPAWSLGLELLFYLVAPLLVRRKVSTLAVLVAASLGLRAVLFFKLGLRYDPWTYRFLPTELAFFLIGSIGYRAYTTLKPHAVALRPYAIATVLLALLSVTQIGRFEQNRWIAIPFYVSISCAIPLIFLLTGRSRFDRMIGELSYPVYLCHTLVAATLRSLHLPETGIVTSLSTIAMAVVILFLIDRPLDRLRQRRYLQKKACVVAADSRNPQAPAAVPAIDLSMQPVAIGQMVAGS